MAGCSPIARMRILLFICCHILLIFNWNKCSWRYLQPTRAKVLLQDAFILMFLPILILRKLYTSSVEMIQICCPHALKEKLEITVRNNLQMTRSSPVPSASTIVGCEHTTQFYAISLLKEDTAWHEKCKDNLSHPVSNFQKLFHIILVWRDEKVTVTLFILSLGEQGAGFVDIFYQIAHIKQLWHMNCCQRTSLYTRHSTGIC